MRFGNRKCTFSLQKLCLCFVVCRVASGGVAEVHTVSVVSVFVFGLCVARNRGVFLWEPHLEAVVNGSGFTMHQHAAHPCSGKGILDRKDSPVCEEILHAHVFRA